MIALVGWGEEADVRSHGAIQLARIIIFSTGLSEFFACDNTGADRTLGTDVFIRQTLSKPHRDFTDRLLLR